MTERTALFAIQQAQGGRMIDFHGWMMPVQFSGIIPEHHAVRTACGLFDLGHMGRLHLSGQDALPFLARHICRRVDDMHPGQVRYGLVLADDGTVEDDVLVSREDGTSWHIVVNASNRQRILDLWRPALPAGVQLEDRSASEAMIALQGPHAIALLATLGLDGGTLGYFRFADKPWQGTTVRLSRTGYTGEDGCECFLPVDCVEALWQAMVDAGATPCGLGARDTLRLEAGMPLYGQELDRSVTPIEAGLTFAVDKRGGFIGAERVLQHMRSGPPQRLVGLRMQEKRVPRMGYPVLHAGQAVGRITSGTLSPTLGQAIGMAYVPSTLALQGTTLAVDVRGTAVSAEVVALPFYKRAVR